jgi:hypothetical protein
MIMSRYSGGQAGWPMSGAALDWSFLRETVGRSTTAAAVISVLHVEDFAQSVEISDDC